MSVQRIKTEKIYILFFNACGFKETSYLLLNNINCLSTDCNIFSTAIVDGMLAVELYIKFLLSYDYAIENQNEDETEYIKVHDVYTLFKSLTKKRQKEIRQELKTNGCDAKKFYRFRMLAWRAMQSKGTNQGKNGDVINWRYLTIDGKNSYKFDVNTMIQLNEALYKISQRIINNCSKKILLPRLSSPSLDESSLNIIGKMCITASLSE